jgi:hypothetical protein
MTIIPFISNFKSTTIPKAFILNGFVTAAITLFAVEMRQLFNDEKGKLYLFFNGFFEGSALTETQIASIVFLATLLSAYIVYIIMYVIVGFGGGMLIS